MEAVPVVMMMTVHGLLCCYCWMMQWDGFVGGGLQVSKEELQFGGGGILKRHYRKNVLLQVRINRMGNFSGQMIV